MKRFWRKTGKTKGVFVGVHVPLQLFHRIALYGVAYNLAKTDVLRQALECWEKEVLQKTSELEQLKTIVTRLQAEWYNKKVTHYANESAAKRAIIFENWKAAQLEQLSKRGVSQKSIDFIDHKLTQ